MGFSKTRKRRDRLATNNIGVDLPSNSNLDPSCLTGVFKPYIHFLRMTASALVPRHLLSSKIQERKKKRFPPFCSVCSSFFSPTPINLSSLVCVSVRLFRNEWDNFSPPLAPLWVHKADIVGTSNFYLEMGQVRRFGIGFQVWLE